MSRKLLSGIKKRFSMATAEKISEALGLHGINVSASHILDGLSRDDWQLIPDEPQPVSVPHINGGGKGGTPVTIPHYQLAASAGGGALVEDESRTRRIYFAADWIRGELMANPNDLFAIDIEGDSMEPELREGDTVLVDKTKVHLRRNGLYVLVIGDMLLVKRAELMPDGSIQIRSDNPKYTPYTIKPGEQEPFSVKGRVVWIIGRRPQ